MKLSFTALDPRQALHAAIIIEERNAELYQRFAEMFVEFGDTMSLEIAGIFWEMAVEERRHGCLLQGMYEERYGDSSCALTDEDLVEFIEVPKLEDGDLFANAADGRDRALQVAVKAEISAQLFYSSLAENTPSGPLRSVYQDLAEVEDGHVAFLEQKMASEPANDQRH
jgi:rubrerythrin